MFKLSIAFVSVVLFHGVFAAPVLLTAANSNAAHAALTKRGLLGGVDAGSIFEPLNAEPRQEPGLLDSSIASLPPTPDAPGASSRRRAISVAGAFDNLLDKFLGGEQDQGFAQRRAQPSLPYSFDSLLGTIENSTPSLAGTGNNVSPLKRQLLEDLGGEDQANGLLGRQEGSPFFGGLSDLVVPPLENEPEDKRALLDTLTGPSDEGNGDGEVGDNDNDDDNGEDDGGDDDVDNGDDGDSGDDDADNGDGGDSGDDDSDVDSRSEAALPAVPGFETAGSPVTNL